MKTKVNSLIKKWNISLATQDGQEGIAIRGEPTAADVAELKSLKDEIKAELKRREIERQARWAERQAEMERKKEEYIATADLRRCLVCMSDELYNVRWGIETLVFMEQDGETVAYRAEFGVGNHKVLEIVTPGIAALKENESIPFGMAGTAWIITPAQEEDLLDEQVPAKAQAEKEAAEAAKKAAAEKAAKEAAAEAERQAKFDEARESGKPVMLRGWSEDCNDPREECSQDIVRQYAMPDGSVKTRRQHTW